MKHISHVLLLIACILPSVSFAAEGTFVVGTASGYAPYVSLNEKGEYEGFDIDIAHRLAEKLNTKLVLKDFGNMPSLLIALQKKKVDAVIWAVSITPERQKAMTMIYYQGENETHLPFLFWKKVPEGIAKIEDFAKQPNRVICVEAGSFQDHILQTYPTLQLRCLDKIADAIMDLKYGKAFATVADSSLVRRLKSQYPEVQSLTGFLKLLTGLAVVVQVY